MPRWIKPLAERFAQYVEKTPTCWIWVGTRNELGYGTLWAAGRPGRKAHRVAWELAHGPIPLGACVLHRCDIPACVNPAHLFLGTQRDNLQDAARKGRLGHTSLPGARNPSAVLDEAAVAALRAARVIGTPYTALGKQFGVSNTQAWRICTGQSWST